MADAKYFIRVELRRISPECTEGESCPGELSAYEDSVETSEADALEAYDRLVSLIEPTQESAS